MREREPSHYQSSFMSHSRSCQEGVTTPAALQLEWQSASRWYNILFCHHLLWDIITGMMNLFSVPDVTAPTDSSNKPRVVFFFILGIELSFGGATSSIKREKGATHTHTDKRPVLIVFKLRVSRGASAPTSL